jgi:hypothetical protein
MSQQNRLNEMINMEYFSQEYVKENTDLHLTYILIETLELGKKPLLLNKEYINFKDSIKNLHKKGYCKFYYDQEKNTELHNSVINNIPDFNIGRYRNSMNDSFPDYILVNIFFTWKLQNRLNKMKYIEYFNGDDLRKNSDLNPEYVVICSFKPATQIIALNKKYIHFDDSVTYLNNKGYGKYYYDVKKNSVEMNKIIAKYGSLNLHQIKNFCNTCKGCSEDYVLINMKEIHFKLKFIQSSSTDS